MATGTTNPPGSNDPRDLRANAENLDLLITGPELNYPDRLGVSRRSWEGIDASYESAEAARDAAFQTHLASTGYELPSIPYAAGILIERETQLIERMGEFYRAKPGVVPFTTTGTWATDELNLVAVGDAALRQELASPTGSTIVSHNGRTVSSKLDDFVSVKDAPWYASGVYGVDSTAAVVAADLWCSQNGKSLYFPAGQYCLSDGTEKLCRRWFGAGAPSLAPFPLRGDCKEFLRPGYKHLMPGTSIFLMGTGTETSTTQRSDEFSSFTHGIKCRASGSSIDGIAITLDVNVLDAGGSLTPFGGDSSANYDVLYYIDDATRCHHDDFVVFGYSNKAGIAIRTKFEIGTDDPDYNIFTNGSTMGKRGFAWIGSQSADGFDSGLSGTQTVGFDIYAKDHHSRSAASFADADTWRCIYADGFTSAAADDINGFSIKGGSLRTYAIHPFEADHASNITFDGTVFEFPNGTVPGKNDSKSFLATANTNDITFIMNRPNSDCIFVPSFAGAMSGKLIMIGGLYDGVIVAEQKLGVIYGVRIGGSGGTGDPAIQFFSGAPSSSTAGWVFRRDIDSSDTLNIEWNGAVAHQLFTDGSTGRFGFKPGPARTIASGAITIGAFSYYRVANEGGAATDDLDTINGGAFDGQMLILAAASSAQDVVLKDGTGNLRLVSDFTLTHSQDRITLQWDGLTWNQISAADNTA